MSTFSTYSPLTKESTVFKILREKLKFVDRKFLEKSGYSKATIEKFAARELALPLERVSYFIYEDMKTEEPVSFLRAYIGSTKTGNGPLSVETPANDTGFLLPLETGLNNGTYRLPRRKILNQQGKPFYPIELGRLATNEEHGDALPFMLSQLSSYIRYVHLETFKDTWFYAEGSAKMDVFFRRHGFKIIDGPFRESANDPEVYIYEMSGEEFIRRYGSRIGWHRDE